jgi:acyl-CoA-binding protein
MRKEASTYTQEQNSQQYCDLIENIIDKYVDKYGSEKPFDMRNVRSNPIFSQFLDKLDELKKDNTGLSLPYYLNYVYKQRGDGKEQEKRTKDQLSVLDELIMKYGSDATLGEALFNVLENVKERKFSQ